MSRPAIETDGLTKRYRSEVAVSGLDLSIPSGTVYGFLGPNGAGKTTTIRMLATLLAPSGGSAHIAGAPITDRDAVTDRLGYMPEAPPLYDELSAFEQLSYVASLRDMPEEAAERRIEELLEQFGLSEDATKRISAYSKGMKQKTALIQTILHDPEVVLLDEPTSGLDPRAARTVREVIGDLAAEDTTVFLSTHILPVVDELADEVGVLFDGDLVAEGPTDRLKERAEGGERTLEDVFIEVTGSEALRRTTPGED